MKVTDLLEQDDWKNIPVKFDEMGPFLKKKIKALEHRKDILKQKAYNSATGLDSFHFNMLRRDIDVEITKLYRQLGTIERTAALP